MNETLNPLPRPFRLENELTEWLRAWYSGPSRLLFDGPSGRTRGWAPGQREELETSSRGTGILLGEYLGMATESEVEGLEDCWSTVAAEDEDPGAAVCERESPPEFQFEDVRLPAARKSFTSSLRTWSASSSLSWCFLNLLLVRERAPLSLSRRDCLVCSRAASSPLSSSSIFLTILSRRDHGRAADRRGTTSRPAGQAATQRWETESEGEEGSRGGVRWVGSGRRDDNNNNRRRLECCEVRLPRLRRVQVLV